MKPTKCFSPLLTAEVKIEVDDLYITDPTGAYWYSNGWNPKALITLIPSVIVGVVITMMGLKGLADFNWFIGCGIGAVMYYLLMQKPDNKYTS